jgi:hypothetical protein
VVYKLSNIKKIHPVDPPCKKTMYNSLEEAQDMIQYIKENGRGRELYAYKCMTCGFWHLTSKMR